MCVRNSKESPSFPPPTLFFPKNTLNVKNPFPPSHPRPAHYFLSSSVALNAIAINWRIRLICISPYFNNIIYNCLAPKLSCLFHCFPASSLFLLPFPTKSHDASERSNVNVRPCIMCTCVCPRATSGKSYFFFLFFFVVLASSAIAR